MKAKQSWLAVFSPELLRKHEGSHLLSVFRGYPTDNVNQVMLDQVDHALGLNPLSLQEPLRFHLCSSVKHFGFRLDGRGMNQGLARTQTGRNIFDM